MRRRVQARRSRSQRSIGSLAPPCLHTVAGEVYCHAGFVVIVYIGQTRSHSLIESLTQLGFGECVLPDSSWPPKRKPYFADNWAFPAWRKGIPWPEAEFVEFTERIAAYSDKPDFIVAPDKVAQGMESLSFSLMWARRLVGLCPIYLAVQDGMSLEGVAEHLHHFQGIFGGGGLAWKLKTAWKWVVLAHALDMRCHIGRVGTRKRVRWAERIRADSIDSSLPLWSDENLDRFMDGLNPTQWELPW